MRTKGKIKTIVKEIKGKLNNPEDEGVKNKVKMEPNRGKGRLGERDPTSVVSLLRFQISFNFSGLPKFPMMRRRNLSNNIGLFNT